MEPTEYPPMSGSNTICVATVLLETGMVEMQEPETTLRLEAPAGPVEVRAGCRDGKCRERRARRTCRASPTGSMRGSRSRASGTIDVDVAFGGMWYAIADAQALGFALEPSEARELVARRRADPRRRRASSSRACTPRTPTSPA